MLQYDLSLPVDKLYDLVEVMNSRCREEALCTVGYGHIGDGNLHLNVVAREYSPKLLQLIEPFVYDWTGKHHVMYMYTECLQSPKLQESSINFGFDGVVEPILKLYVLKMCI